MRAALCGIGLAAMACSASVEVPVDDLPRELPPQGTFRDLAATWGSEDVTRDAELLSGLAAHVAAFPSDPSARSAKAMLAMLCVEHDQPDRARTLADELVRGPIGVSHDAGTVVLGALARRAGDPKRALAELRPLFNKLIDGRARELVNRELLLAAIAERRFDDAALYFRAWIKQAKGATRVRIERLAGELLAPVPPAPLLELLRLESADGDPDRWLLLFVAQRVAQEVLATQDPALARALLELAAPLLRDQADALARVAAKGAGVRLERNTVGLLMPLRNADLRLRGIQVAAGLALALGIPGEKTKLVVRDDQGDAARIDETLALLNADGAAVIVAGFDTKEADVALAYTTRTKVPVVLLRPPSTTAPADGTVFVLGESPLEVRADLARALIERGHRSIALTAEERTRGDLAADVAKAVVAEQPCGAALDFVRQSGADALIIDGGPPCDATANAARGMTVAIGLGTRDSGAELVASAGLFPIAATSGGGDPMLEAYRKQERGEPSWWVALGHDAGLLVKDAIEGLPTEEGESQAAVAVRKRIVADGIAKAEGKLWTTSARGFDGGRVLARPITVLDRGAAKKKPAAKQPRSK